jgi:GNAT superfamily N-acetyltransferase
MITIYKATAAMVNEVAPLFDAYRKFYQQLPNVEGAVRFLEERMLKEESHIWLAKADDIPVGFVQLYPIFSSVSMAKAWLLNDLFVDAAFRGKGIATMLLDTATGFARNNNARWLLLQTGADNKQAQALYEKHGWKRETDFFYRFDC